MGNFLLEHYLGAPETYSLGRKPHRRRVSNNVFFVLSNCAIWKPRIGARFMVMVLNLTMIVKLSSD